VKQEGLDGCNPLRTIASFGQHLVAYRHIAAAEDISKVNVRICEFA
jgi:hypothetical protein